MEIGIMDLYTLYDKWWCLAGGWLAGFVTAMLLFGGCR